MFACSSLPAVTASRRNREMYSALLERCSERILTATMRAMPVWKPRYTVPMPPEPSISSRRMPPIVDPIKGSGVVIDFRLQTSDIRLLYGTEFTVVSLKTDGLPLKSEVRSLKSVEVYLNSRYPTTAAVAIIAPTQPHLLRRRG